MFISTFWLYKNIIADCICLVILYLLSYVRGRRTYMAGSVNFVPLLKVGRKSVGFSVQPLMTWCHQIDLPKSKLNTELFKMHIFTPKYTISPIFSKIFRWWHSGFPHNWEGVSPLPMLLPLGARPPSHFFRASAASVICNLVAIITSFLS